MAQPINTQEKNMDKNLGQKDYSGVKSDKSQKDESFKSGTTAQPERKDAGTSRSDV